LSDLLYEDDDEQRDFMQEVFARVLKEDDPDKYELYLSLLPKKSIFRTDISVLSIKKPPVTAWTKNI
jgi:hypothetical protein